MHRFDDHSLATDLSFHEAFMTAARAQADLAAQAGEVPAGALVIQLPPATFDPTTQITPLPSPDTVTILSATSNQTRTQQDPTAHAEVLAIREAAAAKGDWRLTDCILYVNKEPCPMCAGAIILARIPVVVWGFNDPQRGGESYFKILSSTTLNHHPTLFTDVQADACQATFKAFFANRR